MTPKYTDRYKGRYRTAADSQKPGYLQRRFAAIRRLQARKARQSNIQQIPQRRKANG